MVSKYPTASEHELLFAFDPETWAIANLLPVQLGGGEVFHLEVEFLLEEAHYEEVINFLISKGYNARLTYRSVTLNRGTALRYHIIQWTAGSPELLVENPDW